MKERVSRTWSVLKTTAIGGIFFLLPLVVIGALLGQMLQIVWVVARSIHELLPIHSAWGYSLLFVLSFLLILLLCFAAGVAAKKSLGKRFTDSVEKYLLMLFPRYAIFKEQLTGNIGGEVLRNQLTPVMVSMPEGYRLGMEVERGTVQGNNWVTVYFPGSPDPWSGSVGVVDDSRVKRLQVPFTEAVATAEQLGRGSLKLLEGPSLSAEKSPSSTDAIVSPTTIAPTNP
jgi:uncharacterized membrane protein